MEPEQKGPEQEKENSAPSRGLNRPVYPVSGGPSDPAAVGGSRGSNAGGSSASETGKPMPAPLAPRRSPAGKILAAAVLVVGLGFGYNYYSHSGAPATTSTSSAQQKLLADETQSPAYQKHKNAVPGTPAHLTSADVNSSATAAAVAAAQAGQPIPGLSKTTPDLLDKIKANRVKFITVRAYDTCAEDGDWVTITTDSGAAIGSFMLTIAGKTITIPMVDDKLPSLSLIGDKDGVGGITVGVETSTGTWYSGILAPGESQPIPLDMQ